MELTKQQIEQLFEFTEKKYVRYYDLQVELVDHLATKIEEEMAADADLEFTKALDKVYRSFGMFGFAKIVQQKQNEVANAARNKWWKEIKLFFTWPKITFVVCIFMIFWQVALYIPIIYLGPSFVAAYIIGNAVMGRRFISLNKRAKKSKQLLLLQFTPWHTSLFVFFYQQIFLLGDFEKMPPVLFSAMVTFGMISMIASFHLYIKVRNEALRLYPAAFA